MEHANTQVAIMIMVIIGVILYMIFSARSGKNIYIRPISGLGVIDEAVGRATEMGRPILFHPGTWDFQAPGTFAAVGVLGHVAQISCRMGTRMIVITGQPVMVPVCEEIVKQSYAAEGYSEMFNPEDIRFLSARADQVALAGAQLMEDEKTASHFFFGFYDYTALLYTEPGQHHGAVQLAGCAEYNQVPFFIASCDYTVIGEELFAASAYLTREPTMLGSLIGQDYCKIGMLAIIIVGALLITFGGTTGQSILYTILGK